MHLPNSSKDTKNHKKRPRKTLYKAFLEVYPSIAIPKNSRYFNKKKAIPGGDPDGLPLRHCLLTCPYLKQNRVHGQKVVCTDFLLFH